jgi:hypothetical protein
MFGRLLWGETNTAGALSALGRSDNDVGEHGEAALRAALAGCFQPPTGHDPGVRSEPGPLYPERKPRPRWPVGRGRDVWNAL